MAKELTRRQKQVLGEVEGYWRRNGVAPSVGELAERLDLTRATTHEHLLVLKKKGVLVHVEGQGRTWRPASVARHDEVEKIPVVGRVAAGTPILATENIEEWIPVERRRRSDVLFGLRVRGESMIGAGILDGDVVVCRKQATAEAGDVVVALVDGEEATVKRFRRRGDVVVLEPANPAFRPIEVPARRVAVQGKVVGVWRDMG